MNFQDKAKLCGGLPGVPVGNTWRVVNFALAGYGYVVPGTTTPATSGILTHSTQAQAVITHSVTGA